MSSNFRARRPASPPPGEDRKATRFPHPRQGHLDADERRTAASQGFAPGRTKHYPPGGLHMTSGEWKLLFFVVLLAAGVRLFRLSKPNSVVFDEVHFGKFAAKYIKTRYYVDVHPPLAKLFITLAAFVFGYDGVFDFKEIGKVYEHVPYVAMRMVPATLGIATVPIAYLTMRALDCRATTALLTSIFIIFENGLVTQSRLILLDSQLVFFTALTTFFWVGFCNEDKHEPFTESWWAWLTCCGLALGAVLSSKWVGLFTVATIGCNTLLQLWVLLGDTRVSPRIWIKHFMARAWGLIAIPLIVYLAVFKIHFAILGSSGDGDGFMSSEFQHTLSGRGMADTFADVALGSEVTIRHVNTQGGYLHSHPHTYPGGSKQQQITLYPHRDSNNNFRIMNATADGAVPFDWENSLPLHYIVPRMRVKLMHISTSKHLHSHDVRPPISDVDFQNEVSAYGQPGFSGDLNDDWFLEIAEGDSRDRESSKRLRTLRTKFRLKHALTGCYLFSHKVKLPDWGFEQQEVTCNKNAVRANSLWFVETSTHPLLGPDAPKVNYRLPGFFSKFIELQQVMWRTNAGLTDRHTYDSRPQSWPRLLRGINFWVKDHRQIYLIGNPMIWWLSTLAVVMYAAVRGFLVLRAKRGYRDFDNSKVVKYDSLCGFLFMGWGLHYFPFFLMQRQLFLHHYFPALYFAILLLAGVFDLLTSTFRPRIRLQIAAVLAIIAIWNFQHFSSLAYGNPWTKGKCNNAKWLKTWDFACNDFLNDYSGYNGVVATPHTSAIAMATVGGGAGGRGPIVVQDLAADEKIAVPKEEHTAVEQKPEPGHDVFAAVVEPKDGAETSGSVAKKEVEEVEEIVVKKISTVGPTTQETKSAVSSSSLETEKKEAEKQDTDTDTDKKDTTEKMDNSSTISSDAEKDSSSSSSSSSSSTGSETSSSSASATTTATSTEETSSSSTTAVAKPAGPLGEAEIEAAKVAEELYGKK